jgi:hypothetical protein
LKNRVLSPLLREIIKKEIQELTLKGGYLK